MIELLFLSFWAITVLPMEVRIEEKVLFPKEISVAPEIDGSLEDDAWKNDKPLIKDFITYNPLYGEVFPQQTLIWMAYDSDNLYFAFHCYDTEPEKIKTSITKRDNMWNDDWVGLSLDSLGNKQSAYDLFVNPNGIQGDILNSAVSGEDSSPDFVWYSAGKITKNGYQVEIRIPLRSIRFKNGKEVRMGILFWRKISRLGLSGSWPDLKPGYGIFNIHATAVYKNLSSPLNLEVLPSFTSGRSDNRDSPNSWGKREVYNDIGIGIKYGVTSSVIADITINPDFSQVESDAFQVEVNQRYPIFYREKRPFFMEGAEIFSFFVIPYGLMTTPIHTRRIVDPNWGSKLTGTAGKAAFGILAAGDRWPGLALNGEINPHAGKTAYFTIARGKYSLGGDNYFGGLYSGREFDGGYNRVVGMDFMHRFRKHHQAGLSFMQSYSKEPENIKSSTSHGLNCVYMFTTKTFELQAAYEEYGTDFRMDSAFYNRIGIRNGWVWMAHSFYPDAEKVSWFKKFQPQFIAAYLHDLVTDMDDKYYHFGFQFNFTKQGWIYSAYEVQNEYWVNQFFKQPAFLLNGGVQITKWLRIEGEFNRGSKVYYDKINPYLGQGTSLGMFLTLQPNEKFNQYIKLYKTDFYRSFDNQKIYEVNIINSRTTYQFNKYFFVRAILQYDSYQHKLLTDLLASCTIIPGTVLHIGYGALFEKRDWQNNKWINNGLGDMFNMKRSFFFKGSYLWRF
jgi:hypothetical protein